MRSSAQAVHIPSRSTGANVLTRDIALGAALTVAFAILYYFRIRYAANHPVVGDCLLGSDTNIRVGILTEDPKRYLTWGLPRRHPLSVLPALVLSAPLIALGLSALSATIVSVAVSQAVGCALLFAFFRRQECEPLHAALGAALTFLTFGIIDGGSAVDTYGISLTCICAVVLIAAEVCRQLRAGFIPRAILCGVAGGVAGWGVAPGAIYALMFCAFERQGATLVRVLVGGAVAAAVAVVVAMSIPTALDIIHHERASAEFLAKWASLSHFQTIDYLGYVYKFFLYAVASPIDHTLSLYERSMVADYLGRPQALAGVVLFFGLVATGSAALIRRPGGGQMIAVLGAMLAVLFLFHIYFDPMEVDMFAIEWMLLLTIPLVLGTQTLRAGTPLIALTLCLLALANIGPLYFSDEQLRTIICPN